MARFLPLTFVTVALGAATASISLFAQNGVTPATSPVLAPRTEEKAPPPTAPKRNRAVSSGVAAALAAASPKYEPLPPKPEPKPEEELVDLRDVDKPKNTIIRLPKMVVREPRPAVLTERSVHTEKGLADIAMRRYMTDADRALNRFTLPFIGMSMEERALAMYAEDERLKNMADLETAATNASMSDAATGDYIRRESQKTFMRSSDFGWSSGPPR